MIAFAANAVLFVVPFLFVLTLVVTIHELGHFAVARLLGVAVDRFAIGFGRAIFRWTDRGGVEWRVGWIPLGGYVRFSGDADASSSVPDGDGLADLKRRIILEQGVGAEKRYFHFKPVWVRMLVVAAGPVANFILAITLFTVLLSAAGEVTLAPRAGKIAPNSPAAQAGFKTGDLILSADGRRISDFIDFHQFVALRSGEPIRFVVKRGGQDLTLTATPVRRAQADELTGAPMKMGYLGVWSSADRRDVSLKRYPLPEAFQRGVARTWGIIDTTLTYLRRLATGREDGDQLGGPIRIASTAGAVARAGSSGAPNLELGLLGGLVALLNLAAVISVGIGFMNLLPIPVLDGGHLVFYAYEAVARRPMAARIQGLGYRLGLALLLGFMLFATWNDLQRLNLFKIFGSLFS
jgi:regulator of sigma E protease